ncbi:hypothetical protein HELRODRAFT_178829 [Helobdella robusta]|uniref:SCP domain-containing protein n=1 Tax=Helobdella robusta TaxID=6412 RepID=T1FDT1_HELRO|nr:hypothetical protein HELRODRAFT_178829 [Helobdella robusta]ESN95914.1 hypothetical protein HELRODRAFT_178829 [Helobdella robusta]
MVNLWNAEKVDYNLASNSCNANKVCGHYTQEVWASSYKVGCGMTQCANLENLLITVCNYLDVGNFNNLPPYTSGASCSACPSAAPTCEEGLCAITNNVCSVVEPDCNITDTTNCLCGKLF